MHSAARESAASGERASGGSGAVVLWVLDASVLGDRLAAESSIPEVNRGIDESPLVPKLGARARGRLQEC